MCSASRAAAAPSSPAPKKPKLSPLRHVLEAAVASHALDNPSPALTRARYSLDKEHFRQPRSQIVYEKSGALVLQPARGEPKERDDSQSRALPPQLTLQEQKQKNNERNMSY